MRTTAAANARTTILLLFFEIVLLSSIRRSNGRLDHANHPHTYPTRMPMRPTAMDHDSLFVGETRLRVYISNDLNSAHSNHACARDSDDDRVRTREDEAFRDFKDEWRIQVIEMPQYSSDASSYPNGPRTRTTVNNGNHDHTSHSQHSEWNHVPSSMVQSKSTSLKDRTFQTFHLPRRECKCVGGMRHQLEQKRCGRILFISLLRLRVDMNLDEGVDLGTVFRLDTDYIKNDIDAVDDDGERNRNKWTIMNHVNETVVDRVVWKELDHVDDRDPEDTVYISLKVNKFGSSNHYESYKSVGIEESESVSSSLPTDALYEEQSYSSLSIGMDTMKNDEQEHPEDGIDDVSTDQHGKHQVQISSLDAGNGHIFNATTKIREEERTRTCIGESHNLPDLMIHNEIGLSLHEQTQGGSRLRDDAGPLMDIGMHNMDRIRPPSTTSDFRPGFESKGVPDGDYSISTTDGARAPVPDSGMESAMQDRVEYIILWTLFGMFVTFFCIVHHLSNHGFTTMSTTMIDWIASIIAKASGLLVAFSSLSMDLRVSEHIFKSLNVLFDFVRMVRDALMTMSMSMAIHTAGDALIAILMPIHTLAENPGSIFVLLSTVQVWITPIVHRYYTQITERLYHKDEVHFQDGDDNAATLERNDERGVINDYSNYSSRLVPPDRNDMLIDNDVMVVDHHNQPASQDGMVSPPFVSRRQHPMLFSASQFLEFGDDIKSVDSSFTESGGNPSQQWTVEEECRVKEEDALEEEYSVAKNNVCSNQSQVKDIEKSYPRNTLASELSEAHEHIQNEGVPVKAQEGWLHENERICSNVVAENCEKANGALSVEESIQLRRQEVTANTYHITKNKICVGKTSVGIPISSHKKKTAPHPTTLHKSTHQAGIDTSVQEGLSSDSLRAKGNSKIPEKSLKRSYTAHIDESIMSTNFSVEGDIQRGDVFYKSQQLALQDPASDHVASKELTTIAKAFKSPVWEFSQHDEATTTKPNSTNASSLDDRESEKENVPPKRSKARKSSAQTSSKDDSSLSKLKLRKGKKRKKKAISVPLEVIFTQPDDDSSAPASPGTKKRSRMWI